MSTTYNLTTWERAFLVGVINETRGDAGAMRKCLALLDLLDFTPEEKAAIDFKTITTPAGMSAVTWDNTKEPAEGYPVEFKDGNHLAYLRQLIKAGEHFTGQDARKAVAMLDKLEA